MSNQFQFLSKMFYIRLLKAESSTLSEYVYYEKPWCEIYIVNILLESYNTHSKSQRDNDKSV